MTEEGGVIKEEWGEDIIEATLSDKQWRMWDMLISRRYSTTPQTSVSVYIRRSVLQYECGGGEGLKVQVFPHTVPGRRRVARSSSATLRFIFLWTKETHLDLDLTYWGVLEETVCFCCSWDVRNINTHSEKLVDYLLYNPCQSTWVHFHKETLKSMLWSDSTARM